MLRVWLLLTLTIMSFCVYAQCSAIAETLKAIGAPLDVTLVNLPPTNAVPSTESPKPNDWPDDERIVYAIHEPAPFHLRYQHILYVNRRWQKAWILHNGGTSHVSKWYGPLLIDAEQYKACNSAGQPSNPAPQSDASGSALSAPSHGALGRER